MVRVIKQPTAELKVVFFIIIFRLPLSKVDSARGDLSLTTHHGRLCLSATGQNLSILFPSIHPSGDQVFFRDSSFFLHVLVPLPHYLRLLKYEQPRSLEERIHHQLRSRLSISSSNLDPEVP
jgi:hypothetical protein